MTSSNSTEENNTGESTTMSTSTTADTDAQNASIDAFVAACEAHMTRVLYRFAVRKMRIAINAAKYGIFRAAQSEVEWFKVSPGDISEVCEYIGDTLRQTRAPWPDSDVRYALAVGVLIKRIRLQDVDAMITEHRPYFISADKEAEKWLERETGLEVIRWPYPDDRATLRGKIIVTYGPLPLASLAALGPVWSIDLPAEWRGQQLTADEIDRAGPRLVRYSVRRLLPAADLEQEQEKATDVAEA